jgi:hypothetical protein
MIFGDDRRQDRFQQAEYPCADETSLIADSATTTLQRYSNLQQLDEYMRFLTVDVGNGQKVRAELEPDPRRVGPL